jgi:cytochrome b561
MKLRNSRVGYGAIAKFFHWSIVFLVLVGWALGSLGDALPRGGLRDFGLFIHMTAGLLVLALLLPRVLWRLADAPPLPEPTPLGRRAEMLATLAHYLLYGLVLAVPLAGIATQFTRGDPLPILGLFDIASPLTASRSAARLAKEVHEVLANILLVTALLHAAAALVHHWVLRDRTLVRMLPGRR